MKQPEKAAAAAHTYFQANPEHVEMGQNLEQYKDLQGVKEDHFVDREARPHQVRQEILICKFGYRYVDVNFLVISHLFLLFLSLSKHVSDH